MEMVTSSKSRKRAYIPPTVLYPIIPELVKGLWKNWLENETVMDAAFEIFRRHLDGYSKRCPESTHLFGRPRKLDEKREWKTMDDTEKAPFISIALRDLLCEAEFWKRVSKNTKPRKKSKARKKSEKIYCGNVNAQRLFRNEFYERYYNKVTPNDKMLSEIELRDAAVDKWCCITDAERYVYVKKNKERWMEREKVHESLLSDEVYKDLRYFF